MKTPPPIDPLALQTSLASAYAIQARAMEFVPRGECSWGYRVEGSDGRAFFLKLFRAKPLSEWAARLTYRMHLDGKIDALSCPLPSCSGEVISNLAGYPAALFDFIEGPSLWQLEEKGEVLYRLGELLAKIHACTEFRAECQRTEQFDIVGGGVYDEVLEAVNNVTTRTGAASEALSLLRPVRNQLEGLRENILVYQEKARKAQTEFCICHGDPTPGNIFISKDGAPFLIDWDDVILAPPERDLVFWESDAVFFAGQTSYPVLEGYRTIAGDFTLNPDIIGFYHRQWTVGEIAEYGRRLLFEEHDAQQNESDLANLREELNWIGE